MAGERVEADHRRGQALGDALGAARAAVGDDQAADALGVQVTRAELDHLARADQQRRVAVEAREHAPREPDAGRGDRNGGCPDRGLGANALRDRKRGLEQAVELAARGARLPGGAVGVLELPEDLRLAEDQRVEPGSNRERMAHGVRPLDAIQALGERGVAARLGDQPAGHRLRGTADGVHLGAVAGGDDERFRHARQCPQRRERARQPLRVEHDALAHFDRRRAVIQTEDEEGHDGPAAGIGRRIVG